MPRQEDSPTRFGIAPRTFHRICILVTIFVAVIIVTGGAVRLTESGLGCPNWPNCESGSLAPRPASGIHATVEFVNRIFTGFVSMTVIVAVFGSLIRRPRRGDLVWLSVGLVAGVMAQIVVGGVTVLTELHPAAVMSHFLLSLVLLSDAIVLAVRSGYPDGSAIELAVPGPIFRYAWVLVCMAAIVVVAGTVVTNTGPHAGDRTAKRFDLSLPDIARIHGTAVIIFLVLVIGGLVLARRMNALERLKGSFSLLLLILLFQGALGYWQYFTGVPALLVGFHLAGATLLWTATLLLLLRCYEPVGSREMLLPADTY